MRLTILGRTLLAARGIQHRASRKTHQLAQVLHGLRAALVKDFVGFIAVLQQLNGIRVDYVWKRGRPVFLLPGWPETWWRVTRVCPSSRRGTA